jgi:protein-S-isoprenylcysteine O-methyltransferase Ste14
MRPLHCYVRCSDEPQGGPVRVGAGHLTCEANIISNGGNLLFQFKLIVFIIASVGLAWVSWPSLRDFRSHGFYRFFAFESILALVLLNLNYWFYEPFSIHQIVSWLLLIVCTYWVIHGVLLLRMVGKPDSKRNDPSLIGIEKTTQLVTVGAYRYIRHPLYSSLLFLAWGVFFKHPSLIGVCLAVITTFFLTMTAKIEEAENIRFFGAAYHSYMRQTKMFIPFLF